MPNKYCIKCNKIIKAKEGGMCEKCTLKEYEKRVKKTKPKAYPEYDFKK